jgi:hypothetical protein
MELHRGKPEEKLAQKLFVQHMMEMLVGETDPYAPLFF